MTENLGTSCQECELCKQLKPEPRKDDCLDCFREDIKDLTAENKRLRGLLEKSIDETLLYDEALELVNEITAELEG